MTYKIWYKNFQMFDIELYIKESDISKDYNERLYYTEIKQHLIADGMGHYIIDNIKTPNDLENFLAGVNEIDDLRDLLFEWNWIIPNWTNDLLNCHAADARMCKIHRPKFEKIMRDFCEKFHLELSID